jgi:light-regulated signal transduction histidine kinase (bacteriophytochrome)
VFIGGGKACHELLKALLSHKLYSVKLNIVGVCDINDDAPGILYAKKLGIFTTNDFNNFLKKFSIDLIIEITGDDEILHEIFKSKPKNIKVLDHLGARLLWELIETHDEKIAIEEHLSVSAKMVAVGEMAYHFVDQIRNPLISTGGLIKRMLLNPDTPRQFRKQLQTVIINIEKIERIVADICDLASQINVRFELTDFVKMISAWCKGISIQSRKLNIEVECHIDNDMPDFLFDKNLVSQVLWHVAERAIERISRIKGSLDIWTKMCMDEVVIMVREMPEGEIKTDNIETQKTRSAILGGYIPKRTGFWLNICRKIMYDHGGDIQIEHAPT